MKTILIDATERPKVTELVTDSEGRVVGSLVEDTISRLEALIRQDVYSSTVEEVDRLERKQDRIAPGWREETFSLGADKGKHDGDDDEEDYTDSELDDLLEDQLCG